MRRDVISAYVASAAKIGSWVIVSGMVYRRLGDAEFAMLALVRGTIGILNYTTLGLSPAMIRLVAQTQQEQPQLDSARGGVLDYYTAQPRREIQALYANGLLIALLTAVFGLAVTLAYANVFGAIYHVPSRLRRDIGWIVTWLGVGTMLRLSSDVSGSLLQAQQQIALDNYRVVEGETAWIIMSFCALYLAGNAIGERLTAVALCYTISGVILLVRRLTYAQKLTGLLLPVWRLVDEATIRRLLGFGSLVLFAQLADYLYAPTDYILINRLLGFWQVAHYAPAMQIDAGMLLLVGGLASVMLPRAALAHTAGNRDIVRRYYVYGTIASAALLTFAGSVIWMASPLIFRLWLGDRMRPTQVILPLVLIHTIVGGSSAVGRSILLGMGKVRAFTIAVLIAGGSNVLLSYIFVRYLNLGLKGIVLGTIVAVLGRCAIWMPWYVLRSLRPH
jgi:O-antigen/teichoic acid export membrane protein